MTYTRSEDGSSQAIRNVGILPQHYIALKRKRPRLEDGGKMDLRNIGILPQHEDLDLNFINITIFSLLCFIQLLSKLYRNIYIVSYRDSHIIPRESIINHKRNISSIFVIPKSSTNQAKKNFWSLISMARVQTLQKGKGKVVPVL